MLKIQFNTGRLSIFRNKLERLIMMEDEKGLDAFLKQHPRAVEWKHICGPNQELYIHRAAYKGKFIGVKKLVEHGTQLNTLGVGRKTLMENVLLRGGEEERESRQKMAKFLIDKGYDLEQPNMHDRTPYMVACWECRPEAAQFLLDHGASPATKMNRNGMTPLMEACHGSQNCPEKPATDTLRVVLSTGCDPNAENDNGMQALHYVAHVEAAKMLLEHGADPTHRDNYGRLPAQCHSGETPVYRFLRDESQDYMARRAAAAAEREAELKKAALEERDTQIDAACHTGVTIGKSTVLTLKKQRSPTL